MKKGIPVLFLSLCLLFSGVVVHAEEPESDKLFTAIGFNKVDDNYKLGLLGDNEKELEAGNNYILGITQQDNKKYVIEAGDKFASIKYYSSTDRGESATYSEDKFDTLNEALADSDVIPEDALFICDANPLEYTTLAEYKANASSMYLLVYEDDSLQNKISFTDLGNYVVPVEEVQAGNSTVNVELGNLIKVNGVVTGAEVNISWSLKENSVGIQDYISSFSILETTCSKVFDASAEGSGVVEFSGANGTYTYKVRTTLGYEYTGTIVVDGITNNIDSTYDETPAKVTVSTIPDVMYLGESFELTIQTDKESVITLNGRNSGEYKTTDKFEIDANGVYEYSVTTKSGVVTEGTIEVNCFKDKEEPTFSRDGVWSDTYKPVDDITIVKTGDSAIILPFVLMMLGSVILLGCCVSKGGKKNDEKSE